MNKKTRSPLFHITKRDALPWYKSWGIRAAAILLALIVLDVILGFIGSIGRQTLRTLISLCKFSSFIFILQIFFVTQGNALVTLPLGIRITDEGLRFSAMISGASRATVSYRAYSSSRPFSTDRSRAHCIRISARGSDREYTAWPMP